MPERFCEECGAPLTPGSRFCEECGSPVPTRSEPAPVQVVPSGPVAVSPPEAGSQSDREQIMAVLPFCSRHKGIIGSEDLSLVFTSRRIIPIPISGEIKPIFTAAKKNLDTHIRDLERKKQDRKPFLAPLAFDPGPFFQPWPQLFPVLPEGQGIPLTDLEYIRSEYPDEDYILSDDLEIGTTAGKQLFSSESGWYWASISRMMPCIWEAMEGGVPEKVLGIIPLCEAGEWGSRSLWYSFTLIVTNQRILFASISDPFKDIQVAYLDRLETKTGDDRRTVVERFTEQQPPDAPWMVYFQKPLPAIFEENPVNFFIPLRNIRSVTLVVREKDVCDELAIYLPSHIESMSLEPGFGCVANSILSGVLDNRVSIERDS